MEYDYIIIGAGAAGLMLADALGSDPHFSAHSILLLDKDSKKANDRSWCFWEKGEGKFDPIVSHSWDHVFFSASGFKKRFNISPYTYKLVRGIDFYRSYMNRISAYPNITFKQEEVLSIKENETQVQLTSDQMNYVAKQVFSSVFDLSQIKAQNKYPVLQQHFVGWFIKTDTPVFSKETATLMDFSIDQANNTRFMYVLPFSATEALVEYTLFSEKLLPNLEYEQAIEAYMLHHYNCTAYEVSEKEQGSIPMTVFKFNEIQTKRIYPIGTAGGWTKSSTGYTFYNTAKKTALLVRDLKQKKKPKHFVSRKFRCYDLILLDVLYKNNATGHRVFGSLFKKRSPQLIFKFLDEETSIWEDLKIISACPKKEFILALIHRFF